MENVEKQNSEDFLKNRIVPIKLFSCYQSYFHDGNIDDIALIDDEIIFEMESVQIYICDNKDRLPLSDFNTIYGRLHAKGIISLKRGEQVVDLLNMEADYIDIIRLELSDHRIYFVGNWIDYNVQPLRTYGAIQFEVIAKEIYWENTANTTDPSLLGKYMGLEGPPSYGYPQWYIDKYGPQDDDGDDLGSEHDDKTIPKDLNTT